MKTEEEIREAIRAAQGIAEESKKAGYVQHTLIFSAIADGLKWVVDGTNKGNELHNALDDSIALLRAVK